MKFYLLFGVFFLAYLGCEAQNGPKVTDVVFFDIDIGKNFQKIYVLFFVRIFQIGTGCFINWIIISR